MILVEVIELIKKTWKKSGIEDGVQDPIYLTSNEFQSSLLELYLF